MEWKRNRENNTSILTQERYIDSLLEKYGMKDCKPVSTPAIREDDNSDDELFNDSELYMEVVGSLNYLVRCTRPDLTYAVSKVSEKLQNPTNQNWIAVKRILRYLKST
jgi:hypothetical protein